MDFCNAPEQILEAFQPYYETACLQDVTQVDAWYDLFEALKISPWFQWQDVTDFAATFYDQHQPQAAINNALQPIAARWLAAYKKATQALEQADKTYQAAAQSQDTMHINHARFALDDIKDQQAELRRFKQDLTRYVRLYDFLSQVYDTQDADMAHLHLFAKHLRVLLREAKQDEPAIDISGVQLKAYRISKQKQQALQYKKPRKTITLHPCKQALAKAKPLRSKRRIYPR